MSEYYHIVPWFDSAEWLKVYDLIYSSNSTFETKQVALKLLLVWKARCPSLPSGVESTLTLLEVHIQDAKNLEDAINEQLLRLAYSSAIMRFVNHMLDTETARGSSLYQAAKNLGVPDWIIDMRHDTAHSNNLPSIEILRDACSISLDWLQKFYWEKHKMCIKDYVAGQKETNVSDENKIAVLMNYCISLSICSRCKIKNLSDIPDPAMRESIVNDIRDLFADNIDLSNLKTVSIMSLVNAINLQSKKLLKTTDTVTYVNKALLGEDSFFLSLELLNAMGDSNDFYHRKQLSRPYVQCFEFMLTFLHTNDLLLDFLMELIKKSEYSDSNKYQSCLAALWVSEILVALRKSKQFIDTIKKISANDFGNKKRKDLKLLFHHWFPNEKVNGLLLDLQTPVPKELMNLSFIKPIISSYNSNLTYFVRDLINLVEPHMPKATINKICKLAQLISSPDTFPSVSSKIYTVDDLNKVQNHSIDDDNDSDCQICDDEMNADNNTDQTTHGIWQLASSDFNWSTCPIGVLPWQQKSEVAQEET